MAKSKRRTTAGESIDAQQQLGPVRFFYSDRPDRIDVVADEHTGRVSLERLRGDEPELPTCVATLTIEDAEALAKTILHASWLAGPRTNYER